MGMSRSDCERAWEAGEIRVVPAVDHLGALVFPEEDRITVRGVSARLEPAEAYVMFHKPKGVISTLREPVGRPCLDTWLTEMPARVFPVGRLDKDTTGLMILTDDGDLANMLLHPKHHMKKHYTLVVDGPILPDDSRIQNLTQGVELDDGPARAQSVRLMQSGKTSEFSVVVDEGRNRLVRRMAWQVGFDLLELHRTQIGPQMLGALVEGAWRTLGVDEIEILWEAAGGREQVQSRQMQALDRRARTYREQGRPFERLETWLETDGQKQGTP
jgi:23S rRNA pseudouridine2605 synthase